jgi:hypothetical protein
MGVFLRISQGAYSGTISGAIHRSFCVRIIITNGAYLKYNCLLWICAISCINRFLFCFSFYLFVYLICELPNTRRNILFQRVVYIVDLCSAKSCWFIIFVLTVNSCFDFECFRCTVLSLLYLHLVIPAWISLSVKRLQIISMLCLNIRSILCTMLILVAITMHDEAVLYLRGVIYIYPNYTVIYFCYSWIVKIHEGSKRAQAQSLNTYATCGVFYS